MDQITAASYLALRHSQLLSPAEFARSIKRHGTIKALLEALAAERIQEQVANPTSQTRRAMEREQEWAARANCHLLCYEDDDYPGLLKETDSPPPVLAIVGKSKLATAQIGIVGSRNCSHYGRRSAEWLGAELAELGLTVTSGLALGIDSAAHTGALAAQNSAMPTIAVIANGLDRVYPKQNARLAQLIAERGALVSEFPLGTPPLAGNFPQRNRIISGLSQGVVVVEAAMKSGSLITARQASEQNRELFAVPGTINNAQSEGCHWLIANGAKLISKPGDILAELSEETLEALRQHNGSHREAEQSSAFCADTQPRATKKPITNKATAANETPETNTMPVANQTPVANKAPVANKECRRLLAILQGGSMLFDELLAHSKMSTESLTATLLQLQILGHIELRAGRVQCLD